MHIIKARGYCGIAVAIAAVLLALATTIVAAPAAQSQSAGTCFGRNVTQAGTEGPDVIAGTFAAEEPNPDVIKTFAGADTVRGDADFSGTPEGDRDFICLGPGRDTADGADKSDSIMGGRGNDTLDGDNFPSPFGDRLYGNHGDDTFTGGQGDDLIVGGANADRIDNGSGTTVNQGADTVKAGRGADTINELGDGSIDTINAGKGQDTCIVDQADKISNCETVRRS